MQKKSARQCANTLQDAFILSGWPAAVGRLPGNVSQEIVSKGCARFMERGLRSPKLSMCGRRRVTFARARVTFAEVKYVRAAKVTFARVEYVRAAKVTFARALFSYAPFLHANVLRGLAAAPLTIPAPGTQNRPLKRETSSFPRWLRVGHDSVYSAHPWASPLRGQRFALFKNAPGVFVPVPTCPRTGSNRCAPATVKKLRRF